MTQYQNAERDLSNYRNHISRCINEMQRLQGEERSRKVQEIENNLTNLNQLIKDIQNYIPMMDSAEQSKMAKVTQNYQTIAQNLDQQFREAINREELLGTPKISLDDVSTPGPQLLHKQGEMIKQQNANLERLIDNGNEVIDIGNNANNELLRQKEQEEGILDVLHILSGHVRQGESKVDRMRNRQRRKVLLLWIVVILVVIVFLAVFLYFVFRP